MGTIGFWLQLAGAALVILGLARTAVSVHDSDAGILRLRRALARLLAVWGKPTVAHLEARLTGSASVKATAQTRPTPPPDDADLKAWVTYLETYSERVATEARQELEAESTRLREALNERHAEVQAGLTSLQAELADEVHKIRTDGLWMASLGAVLTFVGMLLVGTG